MIRNIIIALSIILLGGVAYTQSTDVSQVETKISEIEYAIQNMNARVKVGADGTQFVAGDTYYLSGSGVSATSNTIPLTDFSIKKTGQKLNISDFGGTAIYGTLEPTSQSKKEFVSCTGVSHSATGATLTGCSRGLSPIAPYTASSTLQSAHSGGSTFIISNSPAFYDRFVVKNNDETVTGLIQFSSSTVPRYDQVPVNHNSGSIVATTSEFASMAALQAVVAAGCLDALTGNQGCVELATAPELAAGAGTGTQAALVAPASLFTSTWTSAALNNGKVPVSDSAGKLSQGWFDLTAIWPFTGGILSSASSTFTATTTIQKGARTIDVNLISTFQAGTTITGQSTPQPVYVSTTTGQVLLSDADDNIATQFVGFAISGAASGASTTVQTDGIVQGFSGLTRGAKYYVTNTAGQISTTMGTNEIFVGRAISPTEILIERSPDLGLQYLGSPAVRNNAFPGSASHSASSTIPTTARVIIVQAQVSIPSNTTNYCMITITRVGLTSGICNGVGNNGGSVTSISQVTASLSGDLLTISVSTPVTGNTVSGANHSVYIYR